MCVCRLWGSGRKNYSACERSVLKSLWRCFLGSSQFFQDMFLIVLKTSIHCRIVLQFGTSPFWKILKWRQKILCVLMTDSPFWTKVLYANTRCCIVPCSNLTEMVSHLKANIPTPISLLPLPAVYYSLCKHPLPTVHPIFGLQIAIFNKPNCIFLLKC